MIWMFIAGWLGGFIGCAFLTGYLVRQVEIQRGMMAHEAKEEGVDGGGESG